MSSLVREAALARFDSTASLQDSLEEKAAPMPIIGFPLLLIPLAVCNIIVFMMPGVDFEAPVAVVRLWSGHNWPLTIRDLLLAVAALLLVLEVIKAGRPGAKFATDHFLSLLVFAAAAGEFVALPQFGNSTMFMLAMLALVDVLAGIGLRPRRVRRKPAAPPAKKPAKPAASDAGTEAASKSSDTEPDSSPPIASPALQPAASSSSSSR